MVDTFFRASGYECDRTPIVRAVSCCAVTIVLLSIPMLSGCRSAGQKVVSLPARHSVISDQLEVLSDFKLEATHPLMQDLTRLRGQVAESLELPLERERVVIYLFSNELTYRQYLQATFPRLPPRRAYFVGTPQELAVYTFWGDRIQEDLRHEFTHGLLHSCHTQVPLWLDEGLAEYFEVAGATPGQVNSDYAARLATAMSNGWEPDLERLESIEEFSQMQRTDYQEAWAWVHYLLHGSPESKAVLLGYLRDFRNGSPTDRLSERLKEKLPEFNVQLAGYLEKLPADSTVTPASLNKPAAPHHHHAR